MGRERRPCRKIRTRSVIVSRYATVLTPTSTTAVPIGHRTAQRIVMSSADHSSARCQPTTATDAERNGSSSRSPSMARCSAWRCTGVRSSAAGWGRSR